MGKYALYFIFIMAVCIFIYYLFLIFTGKRVAHLIGSKDRFIWNGLKNISSSDMPFSKKRNTLFLDKEHLVITDQGIFDIHKEMSQTLGLKTAVAIPYHNIVSFDYKRSVADKNILIRFFSALWNHLVKTNDFQLLVRYLDDKKELKEFLFRASSMDIDDFEAAFADFDNEIYSGKVKHEATHQDEETYIQEHIESDIEEKKVIKEKRNLEESLLLLDEKPHKMEKTQRIKPVPVQEEEVDSIDEELTVNIKKAMPILEDEVPFEEEIIEEPTPVQKDETVNISQEDFLDNLFTSKKKSVVFERPKSSSFKDDETEK